MIISSMDNEKVKHYRRLQQKKYRDLYQEFLVEGPHLVLEAYRQGILKEIIVLEDEVFPLDVPLVEVSAAVLKKISQVETPQKVMGLCKKQENTTIGERILILDALQDPGNVGTIIRSAAAFDIDTIIVGDNTVDVYNPKVIRATQGMLFQVPIVPFSIDKLIPILKSLQIPVFATSVTHGVEVDQLREEDKQRFALIVGNEGSGVNPTYLQACDKRLYIPMNAAVESLNVAIATSILLYEMRLK